jgi:hypothetical protein
MRHVLDGFHEFEVVLQMLTLKSRQVAAQIVLRQVVDRRDGTSRETLGPAD